jgi:protein-tyrosine phosphatase
MQDFNSILFVCLGNICRSPLADGIAQEIAKQNTLDIKIDSAGTGNWHIGDAPCANSQKVAKQNGIDISMLQARQVSKSDFSTFDMIIALDSKNLSDLRAIGCTNAIKLGDFGFDGADVPDPYFFDGFEGFDKVYDMIRVGVNNIFKEYHDAKGI